MAAVSAVLGGTIGFLLALVSWLVLDLSALQALGLWSGTGFLAMAGLMALGHHRPTHHLHPVRT